MSVVLATRDSVDAIVARITNALHTRYPPDLIQIVVALDAAGAKAEPSSLTEALPNAIIVTGDAPGGKAAALNVGVRAATGDLLVFCDTAQRFDVNTLPALTSALRHPEFGAVSGALTLLRSEGLISPVHLYWSMEKWLRERESLIHSAIGITGAV